MGTASAATRPPATPILVLVGGPGGCGKTTLARALSDEMGLVHICRDSVKAAIAASDAAVDDEGAAHFDAEKASMGGAYGQRGFTLAYEAVAGLLAGGASVVMDQAWRQGRSERELRPLVDASRCVLVIVTTRPDVAATRAAMRGHRPGLAGASESIAVLGREWEQFLTLDLGVPQLVVDTSDGYSPSMPEMTAWIWKHTR